jgi:hypothetical protein
VVFIITKKMRKEENNIKDQFIAKRCLMVFG